MYWNGMGIVRCKRAAFRRLQRHRLRELLGASTIAACCVEGVLTAMVVREGMAPEHAAGGFRLNSVGVVLKGMSVIGREGGNEPSLC